METLFPEQEQNSGYRLEYMEIFNWGGFHNQVWHINPACQSTLVTGANGTGKTTLVDALVTLLVPPGRRHYNQSSGGERKRERTSYSILLGVFKNMLSNGYYSLAQIRWFTPSGLQREYLCAEAPLTIAEHFHPLDGKKA